MFEKQLDEKQNLELDCWMYNSLEANWRWWNTWEGEGVDVKRRTEELTKKLDERMDATEHLDELNQTHITKERMTNDELQDAREELIKVT
jgi:hypothetical protein